MIGTMLVFALFVTICQYFWTFWYWCPKVHFLPWPSPWNQQQMKIIKTKLYDKCNDFTFPIVNFPFISRNRARLFTQIHPNIPKYTIKSYLLYWLKVLYELFFIRKFKFHKFVTRIIKMINVVINIDTPTWPLPTNTNVPKHTQNSYGMCYLHTTIIFLLTLF